MRHILLAWLFCVASAVGTLAARIPATKPPKGFATTKGRDFYVDGKPFVRFYYLPQSCHLMDDFAVLCRRQLLLASAIVS